MSAPEFPVVTDRRDPPYIAGEREMYDAWLDFHRATLLVKCEGLDAAQLKTRSVPPSNLSLLGLVRHMTEVERSWFRQVLLDQDAPPVYYGPGNEDGEFDDIEDADAAADRDRFRAEVTACRQATARVTNLDALGARQRHGKPVSLRWIYLHMIEEYARHNGHADLLRECIDGAIGD